MPSLQKMFLALPCLTDVTTSCTVHGFENARYAVSEALEQDRLDTTFKLNVKGTTIFVANLSLIGSITSEAGPDTGQSLRYMTHL